MSKEKHSPLPWKIDKSVTFDCQVVGPEDEFGAQDILYEGNRVTARFIVRAANNHDALLEVALSFIGNRKAQGDPKTKSPTKNEWAILEKMARAAVRKRKEK